MTIKATRPVNVGSGVSLGVGQTATVSDDIGALLISMGKAVRYAAPPPVIQTAAVQPVATPAKAGKKAKAAH